MPPSRQDSQQLNKMKSIDKDSQQQQLLQQVQISQQYTQSSGPLFENLQLAEGVTLTFEGKRRIGPRPATVDMDTLINTTGAGKLRMHKKQFEDIIKDKGMQRTSSRGDGADLQKNKDGRFLKSAGDMKLMGSEDNSMSGLDSLNMQTFGRKNFGQRTDAAEGSIKINQVKFMQTMTNTISEEDEILMKKQVEFEKTKKEELLKRLSE